MEEVVNYAALLELGEPDFVEVKGVTYCGSSGMWVGRWFMWDVFVCVCMVWVGTQTI